MYKQIAQTYLVSTSKEFLALNLAGWSIYGIIHALILHLYDDLNSQLFLPTLQTALTGIFVSYIVHILYQKLEWSKNHPVRLIPIACLIAIIFGVMDTIFHHPNLVTSLPTICAAENQPLFLCGAVSNNYVFSSYAMLLWTQFYFFIKAERKNISPPTIEINWAIKAVVSILLIYQIEWISAAIAWNNDRSIFSQFDFYANNIAHIVTIFLFSLYVFFVKPQSTVLGSQLLPLIPKLLILALLFGGISIWWGHICEYLILSLTNKTWPRIIELQTVLLSFTSQWRYSGQFFGTLEPAIRSNLIMALFFLYFRLNTFFTFKKNNTTSSFSIVRFLHFWSHNISGWLLAGIFFYLFKASSIREINYNLPIALTFAFIFLGIAVGTILRALIRHYKLLRFSIIAFAYSTLALAFIMGFLQASALWFFSVAYIYTINTPTEFLTFGNLPQLGSDFITNVLICSLCCFIWSLFYEITVSQRLKIDTKLKQLQLEKNMTEIQLNTLSGKIDPHFIFNALNNIRALIIEDGSKARTALQALSDILRSPITQSSLDKVLVMQEMALVNDYISLCKIQFEHRLNYIEHVDPNSTKALIPTMMLQILVENAIKHGISQIPDGGTLSVHIYLHEKTLVCKITNHRETERELNTSGFGIGLNNITERLKLLYGDHASFCFKLLENMAEAELTLPLEFTTSSEL